MTAAALDHTAAEFTRLSRDSSLPTYARKAYGLAAQAYEHEATRPAVDVILAELGDVRFQAMEVQRFTSFDLQDFMVQWALRWRLHSSLFGLRGRTADEQEIVNALKSRMHREFKR